MGASWLTVRVIVYGSRPTDTDVAHGHATVERQHNGFWRTLVNVPVATSLIMIGRRTGLRRITTMARPYMLRLIIFILFDGAFGGAACCRAG